MEKERARGVKCEKIHMPDGLNLSLGKTVVSSNKSKGALYKTKQKRVYLFSQTVSCVFITIFSDYMYLTVTNPQHKHSLVT